MLTAKDIDKAQSLLRDLTHLRENIKLASEHPEIEITIGSDYGDCVSIELSGDDLKTVREMVVSRLRAKEAIVQMDLTLLGVDWTSCPKPDAS